MGEDRAATARDLAGVVGAGHVVDDPASLQRLSGDLGLEEGGTAALAVAPATVEEVRGVVGVAAARGLPVVGRGAAMSYTRAHTPDRDGVVMVDLRRLRQVREVSVRDRYVVVEAGCTWEELYLALAEQDVRTPYWGPLSGRHATVGGTLSQGSVFYGSALHGGAADAVVGLEVVLADGSLVHTGSWAVEGAAPFSRHFGPDLSGLFLGDSGSLGLKTAACLSLVPTPKVVRARDLPCATQEDAVRLMEQVRDLDVAADVFAFDPLYHSLLASLGFGRAEATPWSVHVTVEGATPDGVRHDLARLDALRPGRPGERRRDGSIALAMRADPFRATQMLFANAPREVHLPLHAVVPFSRAEEAVATVRSFLDEVESDLRTHDIRTWQLMTSARNSLVLEPSFYFAGSYRDPDVNPTVRRRAVELRHALAARLDDLGAVHTQVGRFYRYLDRLDDGSRAAVHAVKDALDPQGRVNPGVLGL